MKKVVPPHPLVRVVLLPLLLLLLFFVGGGWCRHVYHLPSMNNFQPMSPLLHELLLPLSLKETGVKEGHQNMQRILYSAPPRPGEESMKTVAIFLQIGNFWIWESVLECVSNVLLASEMSTYKVDVHVGAYEATSPVFQKLIMEIVSKGGRLNRIFAQNFENAGQDGGIFMKQLVVAKDLLSDYVFYLKFHSKTDNDWRNRGFQCLCGTPFQVLSIWNQFIENPKLGLISPLGLYYSARSRGIINPLIKKRNPNFHLSRVFREYGPILKEAFTLYFKEEKDFQLEDNLSIVAGTMFWARFGQLDVMRLWNTSQYFGGLDPGYSVDGKFQHLLERFVPTFLKIQNLTIHEITPAPLPIVSYYCDEFHSPRKEFFLQKKHKNKLIRKPLEVYNGGLGYYNVSAPHRKIQGEMAKKMGVFAFSYEFFWSSVEGSFQSQVPQFMFQDEEPNIPFILSWVPEPTTLNNQGNISLTLEDFEKHFEYLQTIFAHKNYVKIENGPIFVVEKMGPLSAALLRFWQNRCSELGIPKLRIIEKAMAPKKKLLKYISGIIPSLWPADRIQFSYQQKQYWGASTGIENLSHPPKNFSEALHTIFSRMSSTGDRQIEENFIFLDSWNDWTTQAVLEPDSLYGTAFLSALQFALQHVPSSEK